MIVSYDDNDYKCGKVILIVSYDDNDYNVYVYMYMITCICLHKCDMI